MRKIDEVGAQQILRRLGNWNDTASPQINRGTAQKPGCACGNRLSSGGDTTGLRPDVEEIRYGASVRSLPVTAPLRHCAEP